MLYIVSTPIGNLKDISLRAIEVLEEADVILAEDSRVTRKLLDFLKIKNKKIIPYYEEIEDRKNFEIIKMLVEGKNIALVSDAGTPLLSDPGYKLITMCRKEKIEYTTLPGPSAVTNALVLSGLPCSSFCYIGFLPKRPGKRLEKLKQYTDFKGTKVVFESARRIVRLLEEIEEVYGENTSVSVCVEMTKKFESVESGKVCDVKKIFENKTTKGEMTVVFI